MNKKLEVMNVNLELPLGFGNIKEYYSMIMEGRVTYDVQDQLVIFNYISDVEEMTHSPNLSKVRGIIFNLNAIKVGDVDNIMVNLPITRFHSIDI